MKKIDTWLDIQRFLSGAESADKQIMRLPKESGEFIQVGLSALAEVRSVRRAFYTSHI